MKVLITLIFLFLSRHLSAEEMSQEFTVRALLEPVREATISSELPATISSIKVRSGEAFSRNDTLIEFECSIYQSGLAEASADLGIARAQLVNKQKLLQLESAGELEVQLARLEVERMQAKYAAAETLVKRCYVTAPFNGRVIETLVNEHESIEAGTKLIWLLDDTTLEVNLVLPSNWLTWLTTDTEFQLIVDETGLQYTGHITRLSARVDPVSQSIRVTGELNGHHKELMAGMSGTVSFNKESKSEQ